MKAKFIGVFGNDDGDHELLGARFRENEKLEICGNFAEIAIENLKIALIHVSEKELSKSLIESGGFNVVVHVHTHNAEAY